MGQKTAKLLHVLLMSVTNTSANLTTFFGGYLCVDVGRYQQWTMQF